MTFSDLAAVGSFVSGVAVFVTFVFLTLQIRQNSLNQRALMQQGRAARMVELSLQFADPALASIYQRGGAGDLDLDQVQFASFRRAFVASLVSFEDGFFQRRAGMLDAASEVSDISIIKSLFVQPGFRAIWIMLRQGFGSDFVAYLNRLMDETPVVEPQDVAQVWKNLVAQERAKIPGAR